MTFAEVVSFVLVLALYGAIAVVVGFGGALYVFDVRTLRAAAAGDFDDFDERDDAEDARAMQRYSDTALRFADTTPRHDSDFYVVRPDGSRRLFPALPDGVEWLDVEHWVTATWRTRDYPSSSPHRVTFSERGARAHHAAARWSTQQVADVKAWLVERRWIVITNAERGNWEWTELGKWAARLLTAPDGPSLLQIAVADPPTLPQTNEQNVRALEVTHAQHARAHERARVTIGDER